MQNKSKQYMPSLAGKIQQSHLTSCHSLTRVGEPQLRFIFEFIGKPMKKSWRQLGSTKAGQMIKGQNVRCPMQFFQICGWKPEPLERGMGLKNKRLHLTRQHIAGGSSGIYTKCALNAVVPRSFLLSVQRVRARCSAQCAKSNLSALVPTSGNGTSSSRVAQTQLQNRQVQVGGCGGGASVTN